MAEAWFPCYPNDLLGSLRWKQMTLEERGAYWQLICWQMQSPDGFLPEPIDALSRLADIDLSDHKLILEAFPPCESGRANPRARKEWQRRQALSAIRGNAGAKGAASRWQSDGNCHAVANGKPMPSATTTTTTSTSTATTTATATGKGKTRARAAHAEPLFRWDEFAAIYPAFRLNYTDAAKKWWGKNARDDETVDAILEGVRRWNESEQWTNGAVPNCGKFLSGEVWRSPAPPRAMSRQQRLEASNRQATLDYIASLGGAK